MLAAVAMMMAAAAASAAASATELEEHTIANAKVDETYAGRL